MKMFNIGLIKKLGVFLYCSLMVFLTLNNYNCPDDYRAICNNDKLIHFIQYFILVLLIVMAFKIEINVLNSIFLFIGIAALSFSLEFKWIFSLVSSNATSIEPLNLPFT